MKYYVVVTNYGERGGGGGKAGRGGGVQVKKRGKKRFSHAEMGGGNKFCDSFNTGV